MKTVGRAPRLFGLRRHGAAGHWWLQRLSSIALVPLCLWWVVLLLSHDLSYEGARALFTDPLEASLALLLVVCGLHHSWLGVSVIIDDYLHAIVLKRAVRRSLQWAHVLLAVIAITAVISILCGIN